MTWIRKLKNRIGFIFPKTKTLSQANAPAPESFPAACPLRPATEPVHAAGDQTTYLAGQGNQPATIASLNRILQMKTIILELGCGNAEIA